MSVFLGSFSISKCQLSTKHVYCIIDSAFSISMPFYTFVCNHQYVLMLSLSNVFVVLFLSVEIFSCLFVALLSILLFIWFLICLSMHVLVRVNICLLCWSNCLLLQSVSLFSDYIQQSFKLALVASSYQLISRCLTLKPGVNFINCFAPHADLLHLAPNFCTCKKLLKVRAQSANSLAQGINQFMKSTPWLQF